MTDGFAFLLEDFRRRNLGGRDMPEDLCRSLRLELDCERNGRAGPLKQAGITFLKPGEVGDVARSVLTGRDDLSGTTRLACAAAMRDMLRLSGFVAEEARGGAIAYWFEPEHAPSYAPALMLFDRTLSFSMLPGGDFVEAVLKLAADQGNDMFGRLRTELIAGGVNVRAETPEAIEPAQFETHPQIFYERLVQTYLADLSSTSAPGIADPVQTLGTHR